MSEALNHIVVRRQGDASKVEQIAKPPDLAGFIASRVIATDTHEITPAYTAGGVVWGMGLPGGVGVGFASGGETVPYEWIDLNVDGRQWARVPT